MLCVEGEIGPLPEMVFEPSAGADWMNVDGWKSESWRLERVAVGGLIGDGDAMDPGLAGRTMPRIFLYMSRMIEQVDEWTWKKSGENGWGNHSVSSSRILDEGRDIPD